MTKHYTNLINAIDRVILDEGIFDDNDGYCLSFDELDLEYQSNLSRLLLEYEDRDVSECFLDPSQDVINDDVTCALLSVLQNNSEKNNKILSDLIVKRTISFCSKRIQKIIDERAASIMSDEGFTSYREPNSDVYQWGFR